MENEYEKVAELADNIETDIIGVLPRDGIVQQAEALGKTVIEAFPDSDMAKAYTKLAETIINISREDDE